MHLHAIDFYIIIHNELIMITPSAALLRIMKIYAEFGEKDVAKGMIRNMLLFKRFDEKLHTGLL